MKRVSNMDRRARLERAIEKAIALLDELDGDPDLEPSLAGDQPSMRWFGARGVDLEEEHHAKPPKGYMHPSDLNGDT